MTPEELARAVERLRQDDSWSLVEDGLAQPLADLIEAAATPVITNGREWCHFCGVPMDVRPPLPHTDDCALVALVRAINGEGER